MASKACCSFPGRSIESCDRRIANTATMISATRISIVREVDHGRSAVFKPKRASTALATPARWSLNRAVSHGSCSGIDKFDQDFQNYGSRGREQTNQSRRQTDFGKLQYSIPSQPHQEVAKAQEHGHSCSRRLPAGHFAQSVHGAFQPMEVQI